jgi:hypothetical protein
MKFKQYITEAKMQYPSDIQAAIDDWHDKYVAKFGTKYVGNKKYEKMKQQFISLQWTKFAKKHEKELSKILEDIVDSNLTGTQEYHDTEDSYTFNKNKLECSVYLPLYDQVGLGILSTNEKMKNEMERVFNVIENDKFQHEKEQFPELFQGIETMDDIETSENKPDIDNVIESELNEWFDDEYYEIHFIITLKSPLTLDAELKVRDESVKFSLEEPIKHDFFKAFKNILYKLDELV